MIEGLRLIKPKVHKDLRGFFFESYNLPHYAWEGIDCQFVQDNVSFSWKHVLRGMHFQTTPGQDKLVQVLRGTIFDVVVDMRKDSANFGKWEGVILDAKDPSAFFIPKGFAHGFCVLSKQALVHYKVSAVYNPQTEGVFRWNDPEIGIKWPIQTPLLSEKDANSPSFDRCLVCVK